MKKFYCLSDDSQNLFADIIQIWHPCGVANMVVYPEWALSPEGVARGWQCSRGVDYHVSNPAGMSYLFYYTEQHPPPPPPPLTPGHPKSMTSWNLQNSLRQCNFGAAGLPCWPCWDILHVFNLSFLNNLPSQLGWDFTFSPELRHSRKLYPTIR